MSKTSIVSGFVIATVALATLASAGKDALMDPTKLTAQAPATFKVKFEVKNDKSEGSFVVDVKRDQAPLGVDRFYNLVKNGYFDDVRFFRVVPGFVVQFGMSGDPAITKVWQRATIKDDPVKGSNTKGTLTFATSGPNSRTTQVFINLKDNARLDSMGFSPFGTVSEGMSVVEQFYSGYGDPPKGPQQPRITAEGNAYLDKEFPQLARLIKATVVE